MRKRLTTWILAGVMLLPILATTNVNAAAIGENHVITGKMVMSKSEFLAGPGIAEAQTEAGRVQGYIRKGIYTYHGIPYAEAKERFVPAERVKTWEGTRLAFDYGPISPQPESGFPNSTWEDPSRRFTMDNNSQNLNIWTPGIHDQAKRPVMVWLHGGGFSMGSSAETPVYDGANLSRKGDVVVVSVNHRLNVLGHLDLSAYGEKYRYSANTGIMDIVDALRWIRDNIAEFGGDPNNITVFGESGGGAKVLTLMTTPYAKGLFHKGIVESGAVETMGPNFTKKEASERISQLTLKNLGLQSNHIEDLQSIPYGKLVEASDKALKQVGEEYQIPEALGDGFGMNWEPVIDGDFMPTNPVTEQSFAEAGRNIPLLIGTNLSEWTSIRQIMDMAHAQYDNKNTWSDAEVNTRLQAAYGERTNDIVQEFLKAYPHKKKADALYVDTMIRLPILKIMAHKVDQGGAPVYSYLFSWESPVMNGIFMSYHTSEIPFVFNNIDKGAAHIGGGKDAEALENHMSQAWINFARYGNPSVEGLPKWEAYTRKDGATMIFDKQTVLAHNHDKRLLSLLAPDYIY